MANVLVYVVSSVSSGVVLLSSDMKYGFVGAIC